MPVTSLLRGAQLSRKGERKMEALDRRQSSEVEEEEEVFEEPEPLSPSSLQHLREAIQSAKDSPLVYLGSFSQYADDE